MGSEAEIWTKRFIEGTQCKVRVQALVFLLKIKIVSAIMRLTLQVFNFMLACLYWRDTEGSMVECLHEDLSVSGSMFILIVLGLSDILELSIIPLHQGTVRRINVTYAVLELHSV